ncbi:valine--tRNA ligase [uncultured Ferrovibrio sp.]|uniref:valine--tRNA ligase n=1 Tax=uncultured Ferrovibrio sp. TaxID=1576913 RepID=UPI00263560CB|nr:valine--tRNA ligase [uncultured Ferrovibrio sp.]
MLDKTYQPQDVETRLYKAWEEGGCFRHGIKSGKPYTIALPPPNVTGSLHMGHALNHTLQDVLIRYQRMRGRDALWQPGTDHAGIATQMVVERQLAEKQQNRHDMGREKFVERVWQWKAESGGMITGQQRRLGESCDWRRERFTMDEGLSAAVRKVFVELYREGLIYKDKRLVNWDPKLLTAISDLEVEQHEIKSHLWYFKYPVEGMPDTYITVATTRPETMLGDTGVAVHPEDDRYKHLIGRYAILPLVGRRIPIVGDEYSDPEKGSGAVKITPAHDFNDFEVGKRHNLEMINIFDRHAHLNENVPEKYRGMERFKARKQIVADMEELGLVEKIEPNTHMVPHGDRSQVVIEPWLTEQWYVNAAVLAKPAIEAVEKGEIQFVPKNWEKTYFEWMRNIQPWCISRQLWWGHQIPAWYGPDGKVFVAYDEAEAQAEADKHYGKRVELTRDEDVLDTWFSSALWPFSTLGWPEETDLLKSHYPTDVLVTGFDIIFFWVARMIMMGLHFTKKVPFHTVYIHALVRDEKGQKMSKSKGNVMDPLDIIGKYGADALRFTLSIFAAQGRDVKMSEQRVEGYRNFATKLWNAARFAEMNGCALSADFDPAKVQGTVNKWILGRLAQAARDVEAALEAYKFNEAAGALYHFTWGTFCDWYLELIKPALNGDDAALKTETQATCAYALKQLIHLLHPFMPFVTEELWDKLFGKPGGFLMLRDWPNDGARPEDPAAAAEIDWLIRLIDGVRAARSALNVPAAAKIAMIANGANAETAARLQRHADPIKRLARIETISADQAAPQGSARIVVDEATFVLPLADVIDIAKERSRLTKEREKAEAEIAKLDAKLNDATFVARAPEHVVEEQRERRAAQAALVAKLADALQQLG